MIMGKLVTFILLLVSSFVSGSVYTRDQNVDDYEDYDNAIMPADGDKRKEEVEVMSTPEFKSIPQRMEANLGDTVRLPCLVDRLEGFVMLWKKKDEILTVASQIIDKRVRLEEELNGNYLIIGGVNANDSGVYTCQISAYKPTELQHTLTVRVPPEIITEPSEEIVIKSGESASISCQATSGTPSPSLSWFKETAHGSEDMKDQVTVTENKAVLKLTKVSRHQAGHYVCSASNGYLPVTRKVAVHVEYPPEIHVNHNTIQTHIGAQEELACTVHAYPHAKVTWMKEDKILSNDDPGVLITNKHSHHSMVLVSVENSTAGRYYCVASNSLGSATKSILVSGLPQNIRILSDRKGQLDTEYFLQWEVQSESDILQWLVMTKKDKAVLDTWETYTIDMDSELHQDAVSIGSDNRMGEFLLTGLKEATVYQVKIGARNDFGWTYSDDVFMFGTKGADEIFKAAMTAAASEVTTSVILMISMMFVRLF